MFSQKVTVGTPQLSKLENASESSEAIWLHSAYKVSPSKIAPKDGWLAVKTGGVVSVTMTVKYKLSMFPQV
ncbi:MAG: hypothetical protein AAB263_10120, partial [Planctomycetota bacterium]